MYELLEKLNLWIALQINKLAVKSPLLFIVIQAVLVTISGALLTGKLVVPTPEFLLPILAIAELKDLNFLVGFIIAGVVALLKLHTTERLKRAGKFAE